MSTTRRKLIAVAGLTVAAFWIALPLVQAFANRTIRDFSGQHLIGGTLPGRAREDLPSVTVESGNRLCCRMLYCDFRFPLPAGTSVASIEPVTGGFDTIKGSIDVTNIHGGAVDLRAYARALFRAASKLTATARTFQPVPLMVDLLLRKGWTAVESPSPSSEITEATRLNVSVTPPTLNRTIHEH